MKRKPNYVAEFMEKARLADRERRAAASVDALIVRVARCGVAEADLEQLAAALVVAETACGAKESVR